MRPDALSGFKDKLYWRRVAGFWHCFKKSRDPETGKRFYASLCGGHELDRSGGQALDRPAAVLRCGSCDGAEMHRRGWTESGPERRAKEPRS